jgi:two-component system, NtrC family, sensor histidine kinase PilS
MPLSRKFSDLIRPEGLRNGPEFRKRVELLLLLRLMVTTLLLATTIFFQLRETGDFLVHPAIPLYVLIGTTFLLSIIYALSLPLLPDLWGFSFFQVMLDLIYATVLIHFTGGASSVFTILYLFPIITSGILHFRQGALITASVACLLFGLLINSEFYGLIPAADWPWVSPWSKNTPGYLLWILVVHFTVFFLLAIMSSSLAEQLQRAKASLHLTESHFKNLSELHRSIVKSIPSGIMTTDENDLIIFLNDAGELLLDTKAEQLIGTPISAVFPVISDSVSKSAIRRETFLTTKDIRGETRNFDLTVSDLKGKDQVPRGRLVIFQDVTQMRKMEERIKLSDKQGAFVRIAAGMAHEVRNPLAALRGATELLLQSAGVVTSVDKKLLGIVIRESDRLNSLLGDFLLTVGSRSPVKSRVSLTALVDETVDLFGKDPRLSNHISLETLVNKGIEVEGDAVRLKQALWNLLANALEATVGIGRIKITLSADHENQMAILKVQDFGSGVPPEMMDRIFEPFTTTKDRGTGLGLSMALSVIQAHNGTIEVESLPGAGATFTVRIPLADSEPTSEERRHGR